MNEGARPPQVHRITAVPPSHSADLNARMGRYMLSMAIRTICFLLAVVISGPLRWVFVTAAVVLPYVAVVLANAGARSPGQGPEPVPAPEPASVDVSAPRAEVSAPNG